MYREQWDGKKWSVAGKDDNPIDDSKYDIIRLNVSLDWYNPSSSTRGGNVSIGPLTAQLADLPNALRGNMQLNLLHGITPGVYGVEPEVLPTG